MTPQLTKIMTIGLAIISLCGGVAHADSKPSLSPELLKIEKIFQVIDNVSLRQADVKASQSMLDMLELKNQMYQPRRPGSLFEMPKTATTGEMQLKNLAPPPSPLKKSF